jgi:hypothetical protein
MGSDVSIILSPGTFLLPASLDHARNFTGQGELPKTDAAEVELAKITSRPPAAETSIAVPDLYPAGTILGLPLDSRFFFFRDLGCGCHIESVFSLL